MCSTRLLLRLICVISIVITFGTINARADTISLGNIILNGGFNGSPPSLASWATAGAANARLSTDVINTTGGNAGFNTFFTSNFAVLGDTSGVIGGNPETGTSSITQQLVLASTVNGRLVYSYDLTIGFQWVLDGDGATSLTNEDVFSASFGTISLLSQDSSPLPDATPSSVSGNQASGNFSKVINVKPGTYALKFSLNESNITGDVTATAAGIDNVSVLSVAKVPESSTFLLLGAGLGALLLLRKRGTAQRLLGRS